MIRPIISADIVAGLPMYGIAGTWLGVSMGPTVGDLVEVCDETGDQSRVYSVPWRLTRIGERLPS